jgi:chemotaxis protein histidine kinase CheA
VTRVAVTGHERRFRELFAQEGRRRLKSLAESALLLDVPSGDPAAERELVDAMFRDAHSLKGGAAVVGLTDLSRVAHALEDVLETLRHRPPRRDPGLVDRLLAAVDVCGELLEGALVDEDAPAAGAGTPAPASSPTRAGGGTRTGPLPAEGLVRLVARATGAQHRLGAALAEAGLDGDRLDPLRELSQVLAELADGSVRARSVPVAEAAGALHRGMRSTARALGRQARWELAGGDTRADAAVLDQLADPLLQLVSNAVAHGLEPPDIRAAAGKPEEGVVRLEAGRRGAELWLVLRDDGRGLDLAALRALGVRRGRTGAELDTDGLLSLIFEPGVTTATSLSQVAGRGVGLDVVVRAVNGLGGRIGVTTEAGRGTEFRIVVPASLEVVSCLVVHSGGVTLGLPLHAVEGVAEVGPDRPATVRSRGAAVDCVALDAVLGFPAAAPGPAVVVRDGDDVRAFRVTGLVGRQDLVVSGLGPPVPAQEVVTGASPQPDGSIVLVLDPGPLVRAAAPSDG